MCADFLRLSVFYLTTGVLGKKCKQKLPMHWRKSGVYRLKLGMIVWSTDKTIVAKKLTNAPKL